MAPDALCSTQVDQDDVAQGQQKEQARQRSVRVMFASTAAHSFALMISMQSKRDIWLQHFDGDFAAQAKTVSSLMATAVGLGIVVNPIVAATCDAIGRKPVVFSGLVASMCGSAICAASPTPASLKMEALIMPFARAHDLALQTALGDVFIGDGKGFGGAQAKLMLALVGNATICPLLGGAIVQRFGVAAPYVLSVAVDLSVLFGDKHFFEETLPPAERKAFTVQQANPLSLVKLFRRGRRLSLLAILKMLNFACDKITMFSVIELYRQQVLAYSMKESALFMTTSAMLALPGYASAGANLRRFGTSRCLRLGLCVQALQALLWSRATQLSTFYALEPLSCVRMTAGSAISAMLQDEAQGVGMAQGELQGCLSNLNTVTQVAMTLAWARLYAHGAKRGKPGMFCQVLALFCVVQLLLERVLTKMPTSISVAPSEQRHKGAS